MFLFTVTDPAGQLVATITAADAADTTPFHLAPVGRFGNVGCLPAGGLNMLARSIARAVTAGTALWTSIEVVGEDVPSYTVALVDAETAKRELACRAICDHAAPSRLDMVTDAQLGAAAGWEMTTVGSVTTLAEAGWRHKDGLVTMDGSLA